ncbi:unnamed protein product [Rotaria sordida]|uniref:Uncharacterized protein n=1 Tax=Rotaria sordida TaxID=392033 RepID=A0A815J9G3_9BILA|nr:unnamed protein product [Rotaria sordida]CAF1373737.1 unnamed protein product [Rotaria sordida]CAF1462967.1 unnamed protein product [Rotaria sordida]CAF1569680.1 unnamed protein product [Rotaria sordida]
MIQNSIVKKTQKSTVNQLEHDVGTDNNMKDVDEDQSSTETILYCPKCNSNIEEQVPEDNQSGVQTKSKLYFCYECEYVIEVDD